MPVEIVIGPPLLSINFGATFMVTDLGGEIQTSSEQGIFCGDTRFVSYYAISANGVPWQRLTSAATKYHATRIVLTNGHVATEDGGIPAGTLSLTISRGIGEGIHEDLDLINHGQATVRFNLEIAMRSDFADLFEVKTGELVRRGRIVTEWRPRRAELETSYVNRDFRRSLVFRLRSSGSTPHYANGRITFDIELAAGAAWHSCCHYLLERDGSKELERECYHHEEETEQDRLYRECLGAATKITTVNEEIYRLYRQSVEDLTALRLYQGDDLMPAAGVPWFVAIFGRDALIASLQSMIVHAAMARGTLKKLAELQASEIDDHRDAEPGKIPHELRVGELAHFRLIPHTPYYGTADATPLYLIALHETWKWLGDDSLLR